MNTREVAELLGTTPKTLRAFLRADRRYNNVGSADRYEFTRRQIPTLKRHFTAWAGGRALATTKPDIDGRRPIPPSLLARRDERAVRERFDAETQIRLANLRAAMRDAGLKMRDPDLTEM